MKKNFSIICLFLALFANAQQKLTLASIFSDGMVLQRGQEIDVWGKYEPNESVTISIKSQKFSSKSNDEGNWEISLPKQQVGQPFNILVTTKKDTLIIHDVLVGEVWLASGQSNMHLDLKRTENGEEVANKALNKNIRIFNMKPTYPTGKDGVHTMEELDKIQNNEYFSTNGWVEVNPDNVLYFSAVAYYFSEVLQSELAIPIGIIHNAVPGSPIESWMSEGSIANDSSFLFFCNERWKDKEVEKDAMVSVAKKQISLSKTNDQKHPWMSSYNYVNGIIPIKNFRIKGVIWYQGESNAEHPKLYKSMFEKMVIEWRSDFKNEFPFYFVQLTSREDRPDWPEFRNMQRELVDLVPNTKMVVITDVGDRFDTHAKNKRTVGERLGILALGNSYGIGSFYECPRYYNISKEKNRFSLHFKGVFEGLKTSDDNLVDGFEISLDKVNFKKVDVEIQDKAITFKKPKHFKGTFYVRYAWKSYTEANLVSLKGLPVSPFYVEIENY